MYIKPDDMVFLVATNTGFIGFSFKELIQGYEDPESRPDYWNELIELLHNDNTEIKLIYSC